MTKLYVSKRLYREIENKWKILLEIADRLLGGAYKQYSAGLRVLFLHLIVKPLIVSVLNW